MLQIISTERLLSMKISSQKKGGTMKMVKILPFVPSHDVSCYFIVFQDLQLKLSADNVPWQWILNYS